ncbi:hypothetical protein BDV95DRAFT_578957, partial [Massariosphaeria phaeospora]
MHAAPNARGAVFRALKRGGIRGCMSGRKPSAIACLNEDRANLEHGVLHPRVVSPRVHPDASVKARFARTEARDCSISEKRHSGAKLNEMTTGTGPSHLFL